MADGKKRSRLLLNKEKALDWSHFDLELAFPVKKMKGA